MGAGNQCQKNLRCFCQGEPLIAANIRVENDGANLRYRKIHKPENVNVIDDSASLFHSSIVENWLLQVLKGHECKPFQKGRVTQNIMWQSRKTRIYPSASESLSADQSCLVSPSIVYRLVLLIDMVIVI